MTNKKKRKIREVGTWIVTAVYMIVVFFGGIWLAFNKDMMGYGKLAQSLIDTHEGVQSIIGALMLIAAILGWLLALSIGAMYFHLEVYRLFNIGLFGRRKKKDE